MAQETATYDRAPAGGSLAPDLGLAIAFEGCACKAAFHVGVAARLAEAGIFPALAAGSSSGSLIAAAIAARRTSELPALWRSLAGRSVVSLRRALSNRSIFDMSTLVREVLRASLGSGDLRSAPGEALAVATRLRGLKSLVYSSRDEADFVEPLLGSCFVPPFYGRPIRVRGELLFDGGFSDNLPVELLVRRGAREILAVISSSSGKALKSPARLRWAPAARGAVVHVIHPTRPLSVGSWDFRPASIAEAIEDGTRACDRFLAGRRPQHFSQPQS